MIDYEICEFSKELASNKDSSSNKLLHNKPLDIELNYKYINYNIKVLMLRGKLIEDIILFHLSLYLIKTSRKYYRIFYVLINHVFSCKKELKLLLSIFSGVATIFDTLHLALSLKTLVSHALKYQVLNRNLYKKALQRIHFFKS